MRTLLGIALSTLLAACGTATTESDSAEGDRALPGKGDHEVTCSGLVSIGVCLSACGDAAACADAPEGPVCASFEDRYPEWAADATPSAPKYHELFIPVCGCNDDGDCGAGKYCEGLLNPHCVDRCQALADCKARSEVFVHCDLQSGRCLDECPPEHEYRDGECFALAP